MELVGEVRISSYWRFSYHIVWVTKGREPLIQEPAEAIVRRSLRTTFIELSVIPHAVGMMPDHVHVAVSIPPKVAVADLIRRMKGASSHAVNHAETVHSADAFAWQPEYGAVTFGENSLPRVVAYIENQRQHHAGGTLWPTLERITDDSQPA
jgi:putative transposase